MAGNDALTEAEEVLSLHPHTLVLFLGEGNYKLNVMLRLFWTTVKVTIHTQSKAVLAISWGLAGHALMALL